jgi:HSP20 family protein
MYHEQHARHERAQWRGCGAWKHAAHFGHGRFGRHFEGRQHHQTPVNIRETADYYELFVFAPGLTKDAFNIHIADDVLSISAVSGNDATTENRQQWLHHEYQRGGFERRFQLNNKIETDGITARYVDGVLELTLPKMPGTAAQEIPVA